MIKYLLIAMTLSTPLLAGECRITIDKQEKSDTDIFNIRAAVQIQHMDFTKEPWNKIHVTVNGICKAENGETVDVVIIEGRR